jgi:hypothetical protein
MRRFFARLTIWIAFVLSAVLTALIAILYFMFALYLWLAVYLVPPAAALIAGVLVLFTAAVFALIASTMFGGLAGRDRNPKNLGAAEAAADLGSLFSDQVKEFAQMTRGTSLLTALIAGFAVGFSPKLRALLWNLLKKLS